MALLKLGSVIYKLNDGSMNSVQFVSNFIRKVFIPFSFDEICDRTQNLNSEIHPKLSLNLSQLFINLGLIRKDVFIQYQYKYNNKNYKIAEKSNHEWKNWAIVL